MRTREKSVHTQCGHNFSSSIFDLWLIESIGVESSDTEGPCVYVCVCVCVHVCTCVLLCILKPEKSDFVPLRTAEIKNTGNTKYA
jgi:hypothetical protein